MASLDTLFKYVVEKGASDLHLESRSQPRIRQHGVIRVIDGQPVLAADAMKKLLMEIAPPSIWKEFEATSDIDFAHELEGTGRFRCNYFVDANGPGAVFRVVPTKVPTVEELKLSPVLAELCDLKKGLVLVTGPTGSGKSTTLAALVDRINKTRTDHVITIEDPIEFIYENNKCLISQRQVHTHTESFKKALRAALREDPDVVLIGEMRDLETVEIALETAETGHLVFATLHTTTAASSVDRIIDQFPAGQQNQIRTMLASTLKAVVAQTLCKKASGTGRAAAFEILIVNSAVAANIRDGKTHQLPSIMQVGQGMGMRLLNDSLLELLKGGVIDAVEAYLNAADKKDIYVRIREMGHMLDVGKLAGGA